MHECNTSEATPQNDLDAPQPMCTDMLESQDNETDDELEADGGNVHRLDQTPTCTIEQQNTDHTAHPAEMKDIQLNIAHFAARTKYLKFEHNFKQQAAACSASESDEDRSIHCSSDTLLDCKCTGNISKEENLPQRKPSDTDKPEKKGKNLHLEEQMLSQSSGEKKISISLEQPEANKVIFDLLKEISGRFRMIFLNPLKVAPCT